MFDDLPEELKVDLAQYASSPWPLPSDFAALPAQAVQDTKRAFNIHFKHAADNVMDFALEAEYTSFGTEEVRVMAEKMVSGKKPSS